MTKEETFAYLQSMTSSAASIAGGVLDSVSAGILLYAATVELMVSPCPPSPFPFDTGSAHHGPWLTYRRTSSSSTHITIHALGSA
jgi:hypothetical protein